MTNQSNIKFKQLYLNVFNTVPEIINLTEEELEILDTQNENDKILLDTNNHLFVVIAASIYVTLGPFFYTTLYQTLSNVTAYMITTRKSLSSQDSEMLTYTFFFGALAIFLYFLSPLLSTKNHLILNFRQVNANQLNYKIAIFISQYIALGFIILSLFLNYDSTIDFISKNFIYYLFIPLAIITTILLMFLLIYILNPINKFNEKKAKQKTNFRIKICYKLLTILNKIKSFENFYFINNEDSKELNLNFSQISRLIKDYSFQFSNYLEDENIHNDFRKIAYEFEKNLIIYINSKDTHIEIIKKSLIDYLNIFLKGDLSKLPKSENLPIEEKGKKAKLSHYILLAGYISLPIIIVLILTLFFEIKIDEFTQSIFRILYLIWAFIGIFSNPFILNNESKDLLKDILKTITGKS